MGPELKSSGKLPTEGTTKRIKKASMGPELKSSGKPELARLKKELEEKASMGPELKSSGKHADDGGDTPEKQELQWGRS